MLAIPYPRKAILFALLAAVAAIGGAAFAIAQSQRTANVEVRVWEDVNDPERNYISARPEGGSWSTLGTIPLPLTDGVSSSGRFRYGDVTLAVPLPDPGDDEGCAAAVELAEATPDVSIVSCVSQDGSDLYGVLSYHGEWYTFEADKANFDRGVRIRWKGIVWPASPVCRALISFYERVDKRVGRCFASARLAWARDGERATGIIWLAEGNTYPAGGSIEDWDTEFFANYGTIFDTNQTIRSIDEKTTTNYTSICGGLDTPDC